MYAGQKKFFYAFFGLLKGNKLVLMQYLRPFDSRDKEMRALGLAGAAARQAKVADLGLEVAVE